MFGFVRRILFPDPLRDVVDGNLLIVGSKGSGTVTFMEIIKSVNKVYSDKGRVTLSLHYNPSVDSMKRSFNLPVGTAHIFEASEVPVITHLHLRPTKNGSTLALTKDCGRTHYDKLVSRVVELLIEEPQESLVLSISDIDKLKITTLEAIQRLAGLNDVLIIASCYDLTPKLSETLDAFSHILVTRVQSPNSLLKHGGHFMISAANPSDLCESNNGIYHLFSKGGGYIKSRVKST